MLNKTFFVVLIMVILVAAIIIGLTTNSIKLEKTAEIKLTKEQIAQANEALGPFVNGEDGQQVNPLSHFFTSYYEKPEYINLDNMLYIFPSETNITKEEFEALKAHEKWPFGKDAEMDTIPVPIHRISADSVDAALKQYMNISLEDVVEKEPESLIFLEEYNAFYNFTSDFAAGFFKCVSGEIKDDTIILYRENAVLTLRKIDDRYIIVSHIKTK